MSMNIRPYQEEDEAAVVALWQSCGLVVPWNNPHEDIARKLLVDRDLFVVGEENGRLVASVMGGYEGHRGWANYVAVAPDQRGRGHGRALMRHLEQLLLARGCPKLNLQVRTTNTQVIAFYEALGYTVNEVIGMGKWLSAE